MSRRVLAVRADSAGDVLLTGPAVRALAAGAEHLSLLAGHRGSEAARLLPGVDDVLEWTAPWIDPQPSPVRPGDVNRLVERLRARRLDEAVVFTSFHQSALPTALVLRLAGIRRISAISEEYPGSLLDVRHHVPDGVPEPERALSLAAAAGFPLPDGDSGALAVRRPLPGVRGLVGREPYIVVHPGTSVPARAWPPGHHALLVRQLVHAGWRVVVTGSPAERGLTARVAGIVGRDLGGRTDLAHLASVLDGAAAVVVGNTGPAHLAAAVGTSVVSLFAPTVPASQWRPYGVPHVLLGDQHAPCRGTRATECPLPRHMCLDVVTPDDVVEALHGLVGAPDASRSVSVGVA